MAPQRTQQGMTSFGFQRFTDSRDVFRFGKRTHSVRSESDCPIRDGMVIIILLFVCGRLSGDIRS